MVRPISWDFVDKVILIRKDSLSQWQCLKSARGVYRRNQLGSVPRLSQMIIKSILLRYFCLSVFEIVHTHNYSWMLLSPCFLCLYHFGYLFTLFHVISSWKWSTYVLPFHHQSEYPQMSQGTLDCKLSCSHCHLDNFQANIHQEQPLSISQTSVCICTKTKVVLAIL